MRRKEEKIVNRRDLWALGGGVAFFVGYICRKMFFTKELNKKQKTYLLITIGVVVLVCIAFVMYFHFSSIEYKCESICEREGSDDYDVDSGENKCVCYDKDDKIVKEVYL